MDGFTRRCRVAAVIATLDVRVVLIFLVLTGVGTLAEGRAKERAAKLTEIRVYDRLYDRLDEYLSVPARLRGDDDGRNEDASDGEGRKKKILPEGEIQKEGPEISPALPHFPVFQRRTSLPVPE